MQQSVMEILAGRKDRREQRATVESPCAGKQERVETCREKLQIPVPVLGSRERSHRVLFCARKQTGKVQNQVFGKQEEMKMELPAER